MKIDLKLDPSKEEKFFDTIFFIGTYVTAIYGGLWWIDDDLLRGIIFILGLYVLSFHMGAKHSKGRSKVYFFLAYVSPPILGTVLFLIGFYR